MRNTAINELTQKTYLLWEAILSKLYSSVLFVISEAPQFS